LIFVCRTIDVLALDIWHACRIKENADKKMVPHFDWKTITPLESQCKDNIKPGHASVRNACIRIKLKKGAKIIPWGMLNWPLGAICPGAAGAMVPKLPLLSGTRPGMVMAVVRQGCACICGCCMWAG
jgi:hypothetical protein